MDTDQLINRLAANLQPVRPLRPPLTRAALWMAVALPCVALVVLAKQLMVDVAAMTADTRFMIEQAATLATGFAAAIAAFRTCVPGFDRRILLLPLAPLAVWFASVGQGCMEDWLRLGAEGLTIRPDWDCLPLATLIGIVPTALMVAMLRRGAPLRPGLTLALAALAVASVTNFGLQFAHARDASVMVLIWHLGGAAVLSALGGLAGAFVLGWHPRQSPAR